MTTLAQETNLNLLSKYLDVCNAAEDAHRHSLPYKPIIAAYDSVFANRQVGIEIYRNDPDDVETTIAVRFIDGLFEAVPDSRSQSSFHLKLKRRYMEDVVAHRKEYIQHPEKLDWEWIKSRVGMEPHHHPVQGANMRPPKSEHYDAPAKGANMRPHSGRSEG